MARNQAYFQAEKKIEEARLSGAKDLRLDCLNLTTLPDSLVELTQLQSLDLSYNYLTELPKWLGKFTQLRSLDLRFNELTTLPESLGELTQLEVLDLSRNPYDTLPESFGQLTWLQWLDLSYTQPAKLPECLGNLTQLKSLYLSGNELVTLPEWLKRFNQLESLYLLGNQLTVLPEWLGEFTQLKSMDLSLNKLTVLPESLGNLGRLQNLKLNYNHLTDMPASLIRLKNFDDTVYYNAGINSNPLNPELSEAYKQGLKAIKTYLRAKAEAQIILCEAKLILVGEGEVGKTCLMDSLLEKPWKEHDTTHGIEIQQIKVAIPETNTEITLNGWDFGGQRAYRSTHQLFFSAPAVYLVVWKPREGSQGGQVSTYHTS
jgi:hypothetical protein